MQRSALVAAWSALLPAGVAFEIMEYSAEAVPMGDDEKAAIAPMSEARRQEFLTGRACARRAMQALGEEPAGLPRAADRGPAWPAGIVGSISHTDSPSGRWAVAATALASSVSALGIDLECCELVDPRACERVLTSTERERLVKLSAPLRRDESSRLWCAKEAAVKAARGTTEPSDIEIEFVDADGQFTASKKSRLYGPVSPGWSFCGRSRVIAGFALAVAYQSD